MGLLVVTDMHINGQV